MSQSLPPTMKMAELAPLLGISVSHCYELARAGELPVPVERLGERWLIKRADVERYLRGDEPPPVPTPLTLVASERSDYEMAMAAIDRQIADHENDIALLRFQKAQLTAFVTHQRAAS